MIDGEIVVLNEKGVSDFGALQNWRSEADGELVYYIFDNSFKFISFTNFAKFFFNNVEIKI